MSSRYSVVIQYVQQTQQFRKNQKKHKRMIRLIITRKMKEYVWANNVTTCYAKPQGVVNIKYVKFFLNFFMFIYCQIPNFWKCQWLNICWSQWYMNTILNTQFIHSAQSFITTVMLYVSSLLWSIGCTLCFLKYQTHYSEGWNCSKRDSNM